MLSLGSFALKKAENLSIFDNDNETKNIPKLAGIIPPRNNSKKRQKSEKMVAASEGTSKPSISGGQNFSTSEDLRIPSIDPLIAPAVVTTNTTVTDSTVAQTSTVVSSNSTTVNATTLRFMDRIRGYTVLKEIIFAVQGLYATFSRKFPIIMNPINALMDRFFIIMGEKGIEIMDALLNTWLDIAGPTTRFFCLPAIKTYECVSEMAKIFWSPVVHVLEKIVLKYNNTRPGLTSHRFHKQSQQIQIIQSQQDSSTRPEPVRQIADMSPKRTAIAKKLMARVPDTIIVGNRLARLNSVLIEGIGL